MNKFKRISAVILALCTAATLFCSCDKNEKTDNGTTTAGQVEITEIITEKETVEVEVTDEKGNVSVSVSEKIITIPVTKKETVPVTAPVKDAANQSVTKQINSVAAQITAASTIKSNGATKPADKTAKATVRTTVRTTAATTKKRAVVDDKINEKSVGIFMLSKTDPVQVGNQATIFIQGTPGNTYSIEFYETPSSAAKLVELEDKKADANGFVSWSFEIRNTCNLGKRKVIIKEKGSDNYIETSITVR